MSGLADRVKRSISKQISRRRFYSDEDDDRIYGYGTDGASAGFSPSPPPPEPTWQRRGRQRQQQPPAAQRTERERKTLANDDTNHDAPRIRAAAAAATAGAAAAAGSVSHSIGKENNSRRSSISSNTGSTSSGKRRGLGSIRRLYFDAADACASRTNSANDPARGWAAPQGGGDPRPAKPTSRAETLKSGSRWQHQRPLGGGGGGGGTGAGSNAPLPYALLASGEFYPAEGDIADGARQVSPGRLRPAGSSFRRGGGRGNVGLRDHNNNPSTFADSDEGWVVEDRSRLEKDGDGQEREEGEEEGRAGVETSAQEDGSDGGAAAAASACAGGEDDAGGVAADMAGAWEAHLAQDDDASDDGDVNTSKDHAARHGDTTDVFSLGACQSGGSGSSSSRSNGAADTCGGGAHGTVGGSSPRDGTSFESAAAAASARSERSLLCWTCSAAGVHGGANIAGKGGGIGERGKCLDDLFPPIEDASAEDVGAAAEVAATGECGGGKQRPALDDLLRDMAVPVPIEGPEEGDNAGGSVVTTALPHRRAEFMDVVLA